MKKLLSILLISILFCFSSCAAMPESQNGNSMQEKLPSASTQTSSNTFEECTPLTFNSLEEYNTAIEYYELPQNFVEYSEIFDFGEFGGMVLDESLQSYSYLFEENNNGNNYIISLDVKHSLPELELVNILPSTANDNLQICPGTSSGIEKFMHNGITYDYRNGELFTIKWDTGNVCFKLVIEQFDEEYKHTAYFNYDGNTPIINALLNKDTAGIVKLAFDNMMAKKAAK